MPDAKRKAVGRGVTARSWAVVNGCGEVLCHRNGHEPMNPASLTKLVTALALSKTSKLDTVEPSPDTASFLVPPAATEMPGTSACLVDGDALSPLQALHALLLPSGNDAAVCIRANCSTILSSNGFAASSTPQSDTCASKSPFLCRMAAAACAADPTSSLDQACLCGSSDSGQHKVASTTQACCGLPQCHAFSNAHGLDAAGHRMSAVAVARAGAQVMKRHVLAKACCTARYSTQVYNTDERRSRQVTWVNTHQWVAKHGMECREAPPTVPPTAPDGRHLYEGHSACDTRPRSSSYSSTCSSDCSSVCSGGLSCLHTPSSSLGSAASAGGGSESSTTRQQLHSRGITTSDECDSASRGMWRGVPMVGGWRLLGGKTGFTKQAGYCLFTSLQRDGQQLHIAVMGCKTRSSRYTDTLKLARAAWGHR